MPTQHEELKLKALLKLIQKHFHYVGEMDSYLIASDNTCFITLDNGTLWFTQKELESAGEFIPMSDLNRLAKRFREKCISTSWTPSTPEPKKGKHQPIHIKTIFTFLLVLTLLGAGIEWGKSMTSQQQVSHMQSNQE